MDAQHVLPTATPETVREHVRRNIEIWKPHGGYVFTNIHNIQAGVPPENIVARSSTRRMSSGSMSSRPVKSVFDFWSAAIHRRFPWNGPNCHTTLPHRKKRR